MVLNYGDLLFCLDDDDPYYLQVGVVSDKEIRSFDTDVVFITYGGNITVEYERWKMSGYFKRFLSETLVD